MLKNTQTHTEKQTHVHTITTKPSMKVCMAKTRNYSHCHKLFLHFSSTPSRGLQHHCASSSITSLSKVSLQIISFPKSLKSDCPIKGLGQFNTTMVTFLNKATVVPAKGMPSQVGNSCQFQYSCQFQVHRVIEQLFSNPGLQGKNSYGARGT